MADKPYDIFIIGGGVNGCGIARDASGRGLSVALAEMHDLASGTSSASTKLFHGGLRYLEYFEFRLVREALVEREVLLKAMPHISWAMRFVLPYSRASGRRPAWLIRLGLFLYDHIGGRKILPSTKSIDLTIDASGQPLKDIFRRGFEYSDCWVEDSRLVVLNARDAALRGARIMPHTKVINARRQDGLWHIETRDSTGAKSIFSAKCLINAGGPWVEDILKHKVNQPSKDSVRLVRGSHIITRKLFAHEKCYALQGKDGRIIFAIPYEQDFTLIGTTDIDHADLATPPRCSDAEIDYLLGFASNYFKTPVGRDDIVARFSGIRPLYNDGAGNASAATRDYVLRLDDESGDDESGDDVAGVPLLNIFGGKITTHRKLAEAALAELARFFPKMSGNWTAGVALPGGDFAVDGFETLVAEIETQYAFLPAGVARRLVRAYGTDARRILAGIKSAEDLGDDFGAGIYAAELDWAVKHEWVASAEDFIWRRTRLGLRLNADEIARIDQYVKHG